jgi:hypothetical protein
MPTIPLNSKSRAVKVGQVDTLKLGYGELARIVLLEDPTFRYIHNLRAPQINNGKPVQVTKKKRATRAGDDGDTYTTWETDWIGRPFCLGREEILAETGIDKDNCPACKRASDCNQVKPPERRFAVNVIRYHMDGRGQPVVPFSCACIPWAFNEPTFDKLVGIAEEYAASGGLIGRDLRLGPCENKDFQKFDIQPGDQAWWNLSEENKQRVVATFQANKKDEKELEALCGREVSAAWLSDDIGKIAEKWRIVDNFSNGGVETPDPTAAADTRTVTEGLAKLLETPTPAAAAAPVPVEQPAVVPGSAPPELDDILGASTPPSITPTAGSEPVGFDILDKLNSLQV